MIARELKTSRRRRLIDDALEIDSSDAAGERHPTVQTIPAAGALHSTAESAPFARRGSNQLPAILQNSRELEIDNSFVQQR